jgi:hypothetical protein
MHLFHIVNPQTMHIKSFYSTAMFPKNHIPWRDLNLGLLVPDAMSTAPRRQGWIDDKLLDFLRFFTFLLDEKFVPTKSVFHLWAPNEEKAVFKGFPKNCLKVFFV